MSKTWAAAAAEYNTEIGPWWMCLFRGARSWERWAVWCHCLKHTSLNMGPQSREESTDGRPLLRSPDSSDLIMQLYKWRHRADGNDVCVGHRVGQERCLHPGEWFHRQNINVSYYILVLPLLYLILFSRKFWKNPKNWRFTEIQVCAWPIAVFSRAVLSWRRSKSKFWANSALFTCLKNNDRD